MSRITTVVDTARQAQRKVLIPYIVAGDPDSQTTLALMHALVREGADIIELGVPFSDPSSDGPVIQLGAERALRSGMTLRGVLTLVEQFREQDAKTPVVLMGYLNPVEIMGYEPFAAAARSAGVDGVLLVDLPVGEADAWLAAGRAHDLDTVFLVAPTTPETRIEAICRQSSGYLYYVSLKGVTGAAITDSSAIADRVSALRQRTELPVMLGFGIKDEASAVDMARLADGVIVGSAIVSRIAELGREESRGAGDVQDSVALIGRIRRAIDGAS